MHPFSPDATRGRTTLIAVAWVALTVVVAVITVLATHHLCTHSPPPLSATEGPEPGTQRYGYCSSVDTRTVSFAIIVAPVVFIVLLARAVRTRRHPSWVLGTVAVVMSAVGLASLVVVQGMDAALTI